MQRIYAITGAESGIGKATADLLRGQGHTVISIDIADGADIRVDLTKDNERARIHDAVSDLSGGKLDAFIACAGGGSMGEMQVRLNYFGAVRSIESVRPLLAKGTEPRAVAIASLASLQPNIPAIVEACLKNDEEHAVKLSHDLQFGLAYSSAKRALVRWVRQTAPKQEWAGAGIALNAIAPGTFVTPLVEPILKDPEAVAYLDRLGPMPYHGFGKAEEIAPVIAFFASAEFKVTTGQVLYVDGGSDVVLRGDDVWSCNDGWHKNLMG